MFAEKISFLRRLLGQEGAAPEPVAKKDERRFWVRYPANLDTSVQLADYPGEDRVPARIRDISRGGVNLVLDQGFPTGRLLTLEMPSVDNPERIFNVLACVVHSRAEPGGRHSLGCVFSRELTDDDLMSFGARRVRYAPDDQRSWMRFPCQLRVTFNIIGEPETAWRDAQISNISASGVGLEVKDVIDVGALLNLRVVGKQGHERTLLTCVVHAVKQGDADWQLGCNFIRELSEDDFQDMM
jgi:hypothetical protein